MFNCINQICIWCCLNLKPVIALIICIDKCINIVNTINHFWYISQNRHKNANNYDHEKAESILIFDIQFRSYQVIMFSSFLRFQLWTASGSNKARAEYITALKHFIKHVQLQYSFWSCSGQKRDSYNNINKIKTVVDHPGTDIVLRFIEWGHFYKFSYYFVLWSICKHLLCEIAYSGHY